MTIQGYAAFTFVDLYQTLISQQNTFNKISPLSASIDFFGGLDIFILKSKKQKKSLNKLIFFLDFTIRNPF